MKISKINWLILAAAFSISLTGSAATSGQAVVTRVTGGEIQGEKTGEISSFKGIPFAAPPVGPLRWKNPQPVQPWQGVRMATEFGPSPMQNEFVARLMRTRGKFSEDCLYLNVWTPATNFSRKLPVMVWIYGGAFSLGSTTIPVYDGTRLAEKGVVVVSVGYRVGAFGFLAHPELTKEGGKGNFGIRDQIAGLEWVRDNIAAFGGDPQQVTIFGESAGAESVSLLVMSPRAKGLFHRAIAESGALFAPPGRVAEAGLLTPMLAVAEKDGVEFLAKLDVKDIAAARALSAKQIQDATSGGWPCYDNELLPSDASRVFEEGKANDTPILIGFNSDDGGMFARRDLTETQFVAMVRSGAGTNAGKVLELYPHATSEEISRSSKEIVRDLVFAWPTWRWAQLQSQHGKGKAFVYFYDHRTPEHPEGANHAAELGYVFRNLENARPADVELSERMSSYWVNFAKTGNPNGTGLPNWEPFTQSNSKVMKFEDAPAMGDMPCIARMKLLDAHFDSLKSN